MDTKEEKFIPQSLDEAVDYLISKNNEATLEKIKNMTERQFMGAVHHGMGTAIRNEWCLWWHGIKHLEGVPKEMPALIAEMKNHGILHGDDISGIILTSTYRKIQGLDRDLQGQIKRYHDHWKNNGFPDGIFDPDK